MINIKQEMIKYSQDELKNLGIGILQGIRQDTTLDHSEAGNKLYKLALFATHQVYPFPLEEDAFQLTPEQIYFRARFLEEALKIK